jgi:hypothetical protein
MDRNSDAFSDTRSKYRPCATLERVTISPIEDDAFTAGVSAFMRMTDLRSSTPRTARSLRSTFDRDAERDRRRVA